MTYTKQELLAVLTDMGSQRATAIAALFKLYVPDDAVYDGGKIYRMTRVRKEAK